MKKVKNFFGCVWTIFLVWTLCRYVPSIYRAVKPGNAFLIVTVFLLMLPLGWWLTCKFTSNRHPTCIWTSLAIFAFCEALGIFEIVTMLIRELTFYTGRYTFDPYGIAYSDYPLIYGGTLVVEIIYIFLCMYLIRKTEVSAPNKTSKVTPAYDEIILAEPVMQINTLVSYIRDKDGDLILEMEDGSEYCYYDVPKSLYREMKRYNNTAEFIDRHIKGKYKCEKIT